MKSESTLFCEDGKERPMTPPAVARTVKLGDLFDGTGVTLPSPSVTVEIQQVAVDSRKVRSGCVFFALHGAKADGNTYVADALARGAVAIASEGAAPAGIPPGVTWIPIREPRKTLATVAANFYGHPAEALQLVAVTGTNGKTTTTSLIDSIVKASGAKTGLFGTIAYHTPLGDYPAPN